MQRDAPMYKQKMSQRSNTESTSMKKYWLLVLAASALEICWAILLKAADSFELWLLAFALITLTFFFIYQANKRLPVGTVYAMFTGIGTGGTALAGVLFFGEAMSVIKVTFICLLLTGVLGLKLFTDKSSAKKPTDKPS